MADPRRLPYLPISFFAVVMGLAGLSIAWHKAQHVFGIHLGIDPFLVGITASVFTLLALLYAGKLVLHRDAVVAELRHPVKLNFFAAVSISLLLLAIAFLPIAEPVSRVLWSVGTASHLVFTLYVVSVWIHHDHFQVHHMNPAWFIPAVGNVLVPVAGVPLGYEATSWFFFSVGMMFWGILLTIIFYRVLFHDPLDEHLMPTLFILIAPPAVGFIAYVRLSGAVDPVAMILYNGALFLTVLLFSQVRRFARLRFFLSWWAYSFPLAAISIASMLMYEQGQGEAYRWIGAVLLTILTVVVCFLVVRTAMAVARHGICVPAH